MKSLKEIRSEFPQLSQSVNGHSLVYLDSAATTLKPRSVIERLRDYYSNEVANIHRGAHYLGDRGTEEYERARAEVAAFINAEAPEEIVFTRGTTESLNLVSSSLGKLIFKPGDEIILSHLEHHSNIVPWQILAQQMNLKLRYLSVTEDGQIDLSDFENLITDRTKVVSLVHGSNITGALADLREPLMLAKARGITTVVDAAQSVAWGVVDVQALACDFLAFSGHKLFGPTGIGVLYGRLDALERLPPYQGGGSMIAEVFEDHSTFLAPPQRFEAGTPHVAGAIGLAEAIRFLKEISLGDAFSHEKRLAQMARIQLLELGDIETYGPEEATSIISFGIKGVHPSDIAQILDQQGIAVRAGHLCCQLFVKAKKIPGVVRASFSIYSNEQDVEALIHAVKKTKELLS